MEMFKYLKLAAGEYWQILLFKDSQNYCGIQHSNSEKMFMEMNIVRHLPESVRHKFKFTIMELLSKVNRFNTKVSNDSELQAKIREQNCELYPEDDVAIDHHEICRLIAEHFSPKLLQHLEEILQFRKKALLEAESSSEEYD